MTILVNNEEREIRICEQDRRIDFTADLILDYDDLRKNDDGQYIMTEEEFIFWENIEKMNNKILDLEDELNGYEWDFYQEHDFSEYADCDLDDQYRIKLKFLEKLVSDRASRSENVRKLVEKLNEKLDNSEDSAEECRDILKSEEFRLESNDSSEGNDCDYIFDDYFADNFGNIIDFVQFLNKNKNPDPDKPDWLGGEIVRQYFEVFKLVE